MSRPPRDTSSATYVALSEPSRSSNGKLVATVALLGALSVVVVALEGSIPLRDAAKDKGASPPEKALAKASDSKLGDAKTTPVLPPTPGPRVAPVTGAAPRKAATRAPAPAPTTWWPSPASPPPPSRPGAPSDPAPEDTGPVEHVPGPAPQMPEPIPPTPRAGEDPTASDPDAPATPRPAATPGTVSEAPDVAPDAGSPLAKETAKAAAEKLKPGEKVERFDDGTIKARYMTDAKGLRSGSYVENHPNGKVALKATYKAGKLDGTLTEADASGKVLRKATYKNGQLHGDLVLADASGKITARETWFEGKLLYPKPLDAIERKLAELASEPLAGPAGAPKLADFEPFAANSQIKALRRLRAYRYLCDVPYDVTLNRPYGELCSAASQLLEIIGHLDHNPEKPPGVPDSLYVPALDGLQHGNLHTHSARTGEALLMGGVDIWIWDSDRRNIKEVGHRRWSLNPRMKEVAWGVRGNFTVMYAHDSARDAHARDFVAYPSRGYFPISYLVKDSAWSCAFDNDRFRVTDGATVEVRPADDKLRKGEPVELHDVAINKTGFGESEAMIFKPEVTVAVGARYWVTIKGVTDLAGKPVEVEYLVEFARG